MYRGITAGYKGLEAKLDYCLPAPETLGSTIKMTFGEYCIAKTLKNIVKELTAKAAIYNMLTNL